MPRLRPARDAVAACLALLLVLHCQHPAVAELLEAQLGERKVDVVVAWYCEDIKWLQEVNPDFVDFLTVVVYNKADTSCKRGIPSLPFRMIAEHLPNVGRDGHTQVTHIAKHYGDLAEFTFFVQGEAHWTMQAWPTPATESTRNYLLDADYGWKTHADMLNEMVPYAIENDERLRLLPILAGRRGRGALQWEDKEYAEQANFVDAENLNRFPLIKGDYYNGGRELRAIMFGGTPCEQGPQRFFPGMQFVAHRDVLRGRSVEVWETLARILAECESLVWNYERNLLNVLNTSLPILEPTEWTSPSFCSPEANDDLFECEVNTQRGAEQRRSYWGEKWGCDPWSDELRQHMEAITLSSGPRSHEL